MAGRQNKKRIPFLPLLHNPPMAGTSIDSACLWRPDVDAMVSSRQPTFRHSCKANDPTKNWSPGPTINTLYLRRLHLTCKALQLFSTHCSSLLWPLTPRDKYLACMELEPADRSWLWTWKLIPYPSRSCKMAAGDWGAIKKVLTPTEEPTLRQWISAGVSSIARLGA